MANNKGVNISITGDSKSAENAFKKVESAANSLNKKLKQTGAAASALNSISGVLNTVKSALGNTIDIIKDLHATAMVQIQAETQLAAAAKNNPYLNAENVQALKDYASQLQGIGTIGDEALMPMMARLAAAGRTQAEIQDIMSAALDMSASGVMSMDSAVDTLNRTYSGTAGTLSRTVPAVKDMTAEQLKQGDAVKIVAEQYKGMAKSMADATGYPIKLANAWGDLKEQIGMGFTALFAPAAKFFQWAIERTTALAAAFNKLAGIPTGADAGNIKPSDALKKQIDDANAQMEAVQKRLELLRKQQADAEANVSKAEREALGAGYKEAQADYEIAKKRRDDVQSEVDRLTAQREALKAEEQAIKADIAQKRDSGELDESTAEGKKAADALLAQQKANRDAQNKLKGILDAKLKELKAEQRALNLAEGDLANAAGSVGDSAIADKIAQAEAELKGLADTIDQTTEQYNELVKAEQDAAGGTDGTDGAGKEDTAAEARKKNADALKAQLDAIQRQYDLDEKLTGERNKLAEAQAVLNAQTQSYLSLLSDEDAKVEASSPLAQSRLADIKAQSEAVKQLADAEAARAALAKRYAEAQAALDAQAAENADIMASKQARSGERCPFAIPRARQCSNTDAKRPTRRLGRGSLTVRLASSRSRQKQRSGQGIL